MDLYATFGPLDGDLRRTHARGGRGSLGPMWVVTEDRNPAGRHARFDVAVALLVAVAGQFELWGNAAIRPHAAGATPLYLAMSLGLLGRRHWPVPSGTFVVACGAAALLTGVPMNEMFVPVLAFLVAQYSVGAYSDRKPALLGLALALGMAWATIATIKGPTAVGDFGMSGLQLAGAWGAGRLVRHRLDDATVAERCLIEAQHLATSTLRNAVTQERMRIARELHDIVSHGLSLMIVQAAAAELALTGDQISAHASLTAVQEVGREALGEMQRLLGLLRWAGDDDGLAPQPSIESLDRLVDQVRHAGLPIEFTIEGHVRPLSPGLDVCVYRVVQEALTNVVAHARTAPTRALLRYGAESIDVEVVNGAGNGAQTIKPAGQGHGLVGLRERVSVFGGDLRFGPTPTGGFEVLANLPTGAS